MSPKITETSATEFFFTELDAHLQILDISIAYNLIECIPREVYLKAFIQGYVNWGLTEVATGENMRENMNCLVTLSNTCC